MARPPPSAAPGRSAERRGGVRKVLPPLSIAKLKVQADVPIPEYRAKRGTTRYDDIFDALKPNHSVAIPREYKAAIAKAAQVRTKHHGGKYVVRAINETEARLWRTA